MGIQTPYQFKPQETKNYLINGNLDFWQRIEGNSLSTTGYGPDRFYCAFSGTASLSRQTSGAPTGSIYYTRSAATANTSQANVYQALASEVLASIKGKTVTVSVLLRRNSSFSGNLTLGVQKSATANSVTTGFSSINSVTIPAASLSTTDWTRFSITVAVPNDGTANGLRVSVTGVMNNGDYWESAQWMLSEGAAAAPFVRYATSYANELVECQRYYEKSYDLDVAPGALVLAGMASWRSSSLLSNSETGCITYFKVSKRATPTVTVYNPSSGGTGTVRDVSNSVDINWGTASIGVSSVAWSKTSGGTGLADAAVVRFQWTADAEL